MRRACRGRLRDRCRSLRPACFAPVMATGIVSRDLAQAGARTASGVLFGLAAALYVGLLAATALKAVHHRSVVRSELRDPACLFGHFTLVAASGVLAARLGAAPACALLAVAAAAWAALARAGVRLLTPGALRQADGSWFLATVGLQSVVVAATELRPGRPALTVLAGVWLTAVLLYAATLAAVVRRLWRHAPGPDGLAPGYWVTMGAAAISTLAGAQLLTHDLPPSLRAPLTGAVTALWAWATLLIPVLLAAGAWRHGRHRVPLAYEPGLWTIVFPLGMYAAATDRLSLARGLDALTLSQRPLTWAALTAWLAVATLTVRARLGAGPRT